MLTTKILFIVALAGIGAVLQRPIDAIFRDLVLVIATMICFSSNARTVNPYEQFTSQIGILGRKYRNELVKLDGMKTLEEIFSIIDKFYGQQLLLFRIAEAWQMSKQDVIDSFEDKQLGDEAFAKFVDDLGDCAKGVPPKNVTLSLRNDAG